MSKIRVLQVVESFGFGGVESFLINYYKNIDRSQIQFDFYVLCTGSSPQQSVIEELGGNIYFANDEYSTIRLIKLIPKWKKFMKNGKYDIVHSHCNLINAWVLLAAKKAGVPVRLSHSHNTRHIFGSPLQKYYSYLRRWIIRRDSTLMLACGRLAGETMYGDKSLFLVINNGIDASRFFSPKGLDELKREFNTDGKRVYINVNRLCEQKNQTFVIDVFNEIIKRAPQSLLLIAGPSDVDDTEQQMMSKIKDYGLSDSVKVLGPRTDVAQLYNIADCCIFPSRWEGLPISLLETQAAQLPTLVSDSVTNEVDLGIGFLSFLSLELLPHKWAEKAITYSLDRKASEDVQRVFEEKGYDIRIEAKKLGDLYTRLLEESK